MSEQEKFFRNLNICYYLFACLVFVTMIATACGYRMDATDKSATERSGLMLLIDHETGIHYVSDGKGGMMLRQGEYKK